MQARRLKVIHRPGGYEAYKDQVPIQGANWRAILAIASLIFACGAVTTLAVVLPRVFAAPALPTQQILMAELTAELTEPVQPETTQDSNYSVAVSTPLPTLTPTSTPTEVATDVPFDVLFATLDAMQTSAATWSALAAMMPTSTATSTALPTATPYTRWAVVTVDRAIVRASSGINYAALDVVSRGARYPVIQQHGGWTQIEMGYSYPTWVASHLLRIEGE